MKKVIITFDYEIYFDGSNRYSALIDNTNRILKLAKSYNTKLVFFIDIFYLIKLKEYQQFLMYGELESQIKHIVTEGHEIQYHFHPHWINSKYDINADKWVFNINEYSLSDIINLYGKEKAKEYFDHGLKILKEISLTSPIAYRAGGLSVDQCQSELFDFLTSNRIKIDSSIMRGLYLVGEKIKIDHTNAPNLSKWIISRDEGFLQNSNKIDDTLIEIPIMSIDKSEINRFSRLITSLIYRIKVLLSKTENKNNLIEGKPIDLKVFKSVYPLTITFDKSRIRDLVILKFYTKEYLKNERDTLCMLSHPKSFYAQSFELFNNYLKWLSRKKRFSIVGFKDL